MGAWRCGAGPLGGEPRARPFLSRLEKEGCFSTTISTCEQRGAQAAQTPRQAHQSPPRLKELNYNRLESYVREGHQWKLVAEMEGGYANEAYKPKLKQENH